MRERCILPTVRAKGMSALYFVVVDYSARCDWGISRQQNQVMLYAVGIIQRPDPWDCSPIPLGRGVDEDGARSDRISVYCANANAADIPAIYQKLCVSMPTVTTSSSGATYCTYFCVSATNLWRIYTDPANDVERRLRAHLRYYASRGMRTSCDMPERAPGTLEGNLVQLMGLQDSNTHKLHRVDLQFRDGQLHCHRVRKANPLEGYGTPLNPDAGCGANSGASALSDCCDPASPYNYCRQEILACVYGASGENEFPDLQSQYKRFLECETKYKNLGCATKPLQDETDPNPTPTPTPQQQSPKKAKTSHVILYALLIGGVAYAAYKYRGAK